MTTFLAIVLSVALILGIIFFVFRAVFYWAVGILVFLFILSAASYLISWSDSLPAGLPRPMDSMVDVLRAPVAFAVDWVDSLLSRLARS